MADFRATYRLQLGPDLDFARARALVPYLGKLGISHLYLSPVWRARPGSTHGYDVCDPAEVSPELGGEAELRALADAAHEQGMGLLLDVVPNHMATDDSNPYWRDEERRARFFDLDPVTGRHRRFFDVDELAGVRQEDPVVFAATHSKVLELVRDGVADGVRIDHPDGLANPREYLERLREGGVEHVWVEKILEAGGEHLRASWATEGTSGYEFCVDLATLWVDPAGEAALTELWHELSGDPRPFEEWAAEAKAEQAQTTFTPELERLQRVADVPGTVEAVATLPVYRTYIEPGREVEAEDRELLTGLPDAIREAAVGATAPPEWVVRFQQTTSPVMAKGVEDTAFYRYYRLLALNEVGGDPGRFSMPVTEFHAANAERAAHYPLAMLATSTHDTKRSHDVRARIGALSSMASEWAGAVRHWHEQNAAMRPDAVTAAEELFILQTLIGAWPIDAERIAGYLTKALREAKQHTNWVEPDEAHEKAVIGYATALLDHGPFRYGFDGWAARLDDAGLRATLGQLLVKLTVPGVPDTYQGDELAFLALVDPDNRRDVDWETREKLLDGLLAGGAPDSATLKLDLVHRCLDLRARRPGAFTGAYDAISAGEDVIAYGRGGEVIAAVALRETATGAEGWNLPSSYAGTWRDVLHGAVHELPGGASLATALGPDGRALLEREG